MNAAMSYDVTITNDVEYVEHDGVKLTGDLYLPKGLAKAPVIVAVHGGGWQVGTRTNYQNWGPYLAKRGIGLFAISYRLSKPGQKTYPAAICDVRAAVQFVRANAARLSVDPDRIGAMGDSAGAHLVSMVALAGQEPEFANVYPNDPHATVPTNVKAAIGFYGVYDLTAQWHHDQLARPRDQITEKFIGLTPMQSRRAFFDASPLSYATIGQRERTGTQFLLVHGTHDDVVDSATQGEVFLGALKQAGFFARRIMIPGAGHFFAGDPIEEPTSICAQIAPAMLRFLQAGL